MYCLWQFYKPNKYPQSLRIIDISVPTKIRVHMSFLFFEPFVLKKKKKNKKMMMLNKTPYHSPIHL